MTRVTAFVAAIGLCLALLPLDSARALPSFARQTGQECAACHNGIAGHSVAPTFPRLAAQHAGYIAEQLHNFRDNARANETMHQTALPLADDEIAALAAYLSSL